MAANPSLDIVLVDNAIFFVNGDIAVGESDVQHVSDTIAAFPGWWKEHPADGVGILSYLNSTGREQELNRAMKIQLNSDGYRVDEAGISTLDGRLIFNPNAEKL